MLRDKKINTTYVSSIKKVLILDKSFLYIVFLSFVQVLAETLSVFSIMPFISLISNPELINENQTILSFFKYIQLYIHFNEKDFIFASGIIGILALCISFIVRAFSLYKINAYIEHRRDNISFKVFKNILSFKYAEFIKHHNAEFIKTVITEVDQVVAQVLRPLILLVSNTLLALVMMTVLFMINFKVTILLFLVLFSAYLFIYLIVKSKFLKMGEDIVTLNKNRSKILIETLNNFRLIRIRNKEDIFLNKYKTISEEYSSYQASNQTLAYIPSYLVESFLLIMVLGVSLVMLDLYNEQSFEINKLLPYIGMYAMAGLKLKPAFQNIYQGFSSAKWGLGMISSINNYLKKTINEYDLFDYKYDNNTYIELKNINYNIGETSILKNCNLKIDKGEFVAIVGETGSGKSTILDIISGFLIPTNGDLKIGYKDLSLKDWQKKISYVDQSPILFDDTILNNITFGSKEPLDEVKLNKAIEFSQLKNVIDEKDAKSFYIGESGNKLSGGQRQRLAIARAYYYGAEILILDEPTSALDPETTFKIMDDLVKLKGEVTIIMITHNNSNLDFTDRVIKINKGGQIEYK